MAGKNMIAFIFSQYASGGTAKNQFGLERVANGAKIRKSRAKNAARNGRRSNARREAGMKTLKEAIEDAAFHADNRGPIGWAQCFSAELERLGYCIAPMEATEEMLDRAWKSRKSGKVQTLLERTYLAFLAARPKIEDVR
jgi:hypothetical protein